MEAHGRNHSFPDDGRLTVEEAAFIERNRFYAVSIAKSLWSRDHRAFGLDDVIGVAYVAMLEAALAWRKLTGEPARDYRFIFFAGLRIKRACYAFVVSNERAFHRTADQVRRARKGQGTDASRVMLLGGGRASPLHLAGAQWGVRRGRTGRPLYRVAEDPPAEIQAGARQLLRAALIDAAAGYGGREAEAARLICDERLPFAAPYQISCGAIADLAGLRRKRVERMQARILKRARRRLAREVAVVGQGPRNGDTCPPAGAGGGGGDSGWADSAAGLSGGLVSGAA